MNSKNAKAARRIAKQVQTENTEAIILQWLNYQINRPLKQRIKLAIFILRGRRK